MTESETATICKAMGDENRIRIIQMLTKGELCACRLLEALNITQPTLSHHMKILSGCSLINTRKDGKWSYYSINCQRFKEFKKYIEGISCGLEKETGCCCND